MYNILMFVKKLLVITGPTATGKTDLGLELAEKFNGEIISADSRQVYRGMDIGTGKDIKHFQWGLDLVNPGEPFSVSDWVIYARKVIKDIYSRNKLPVVVGGTGQYIKELLDPSETLHLLPNQELRSKNYGLVELQELLQEKDMARWERMNESDRKNPRRLVRAIEVARTSREMRKPVQHDTYGVLIIGLTAPYAEIYKRIDARVEARLKAGIEKEREKLAKFNLPDTFGYKDQTVQEWKFSEHAYARRQMSYLKKFLPKTIWFDITTKNWKNEVCLMVENTVNIWLEEKN